MGERREQNKREMRQRISDVATEMFLARGFDAVTFDDIAARAKVSRMTVFNYFPRKEDLMLDRQDDLKLMFFREAMRAAPTRPITALREFVAALRTQKHPFARFDRRTVEWWRFVAASPSLEGRLRELDDEAADGLAHELGSSGLARLAAAVIVVSVRTAREEAVRVLERGGASKKAGAAFFELLDHGLAAADGLIAASASTRPRRARAA